MGTGCRVGWADILKTLLDVYLLSSNFAILTNQKKKRQPGRPLVMTIRSSAPLFGRGDYCISSLTWASCVAYPSGRQRRPDDGVSKSKTPTSFFVSVRIWAVAGQLIQTRFIMLKTDFESPEKKPLYVSPAVKEIELVTSQRILAGSDQDMNSENGVW